MASSESPVVVTGATGYVGGRLVPSLLAAGHSVRCVARRPEELSDRSWKDRVEIVKADLSHPEEISKALNGAQAAYYLLHSMSSSDDFAEVESTMAAEFSKAAEREGLNQIIYLGGLGHDDVKNSAHLSSRHRVGRLLASGSTPVTELRAAVIIGPSKTVDPSGPGADTETFVSLGELGEPVADSTSPALDRLSDERRRRRGRTRGLCQGNK